ncbi:MAG: 50S ribosomal protein L6 [Proteobacteria bacterium]|nr:50S ribosomal protein L6 [Pseudomonadota bacterium]
MSRIGKLPVEVSAGVKVQLDGRVLSVSGPKGTLTREFVPEVQLLVEGNTVVVKPSNSGKRAKAMWGLSRTLVVNMITGVSKGYSKTLEINGVGYKASLIDNTLLQLFLGYSHNIIYALPDGVTAELPKATTITLSGPDKELVGLVAAEIRQMRKPEPYKGKGVRYSDEYVRRKEGKKK